MTDTVLSAGARADSRYFYFRMALACMAVAFLGFAPTYWMPMAGGGLKVDPVVHIHGVIFFTWTLYYVFQTWLAATGQVARHRNVGLIGVSLATAMLIFGVLISIHSMRLSAAAGQTAQGEAFSIVPLTTIASFAVLIVFALANVRRPEWHKRLMLLAAISILGAALARVFRTLLAPPGNDIPPVAASIAPVLTADLLLIAPLLYDWRKHGRPHPVYLVGGGIMVAIHVLRVPFSGSHAWHAFAGWLSGLAG
jgi:hypothetical protein